MFYESKKGNNKIIVIHKKTRLVCHDTTTHPQIQQISRLSAHVPVKHVLSICPNVQNIGHQTQEPLLLSPVAA